MNDIEDRHGFARFAFGIDGGSAEIDDKEQHADDE